MNRFRVWVRPVDDFCHIRVQGDENARWLVDQLAAAFIFRTFEPMEEQRSNACWTFRVPFNPPLDGAGLRRVLTGIREVQLVTDPAW